MITRIVGVPYQLLREVMKELLIKAALIVVRLCHSSVHACGVDPSANYVTDIVYLFGLNRRQGRMKIRIETTKFVCACIINFVIVVSCIALTLCSTSWTKLWQNPKLSSFHGQLTMVDGSHGEGNEWQVDFINQWSTFHSHLSYAIGECPVNKIYNFSRCKLKLVLLNSSSRQRLLKKGSLNLLYERLWSM